MRKHVGFAVFAMSGLFVSAAHAAGTGGCESFDFPVAKELQWMQQADVALVSSGASLPQAPQKAMVVSLVPVADAKFVVEPQGKAKGADGTHAAVVTLDSAGTAGLYQVSLSAKAWIDVVQDGKIVKSGAHSGKSDCEGLRKSVRFELGSGPVTLQITGVAETTIKVTVRKAD